MKKLTASILSLILLIALMSPVYAEEAVAAVPSTEATEASETAPETNVPDYTGPTQEQSFITMTLLLQMRSNMPVEENLAQLYKTVNGLKANVKDVSLTSQEFMSILFYTWAHGPELSVSSSGTSVKCMWTYNIKEVGSEQLRIYWSPETGVWSLGTQAKTQTVNIK